MIPSASSSLTASAVQMGSRVPLDRRLAQAGVCLFEPGRERGVLAGERVRVDREVDCAHVARIDNKM